MRTVRAAILGLAVLLLAGCFSDSESDGQSNIGPTDPTSGNGAPQTPPPSAGFAVLYQPSIGVFPYPIDLYFSGTDDGTLNLPANPFQPTVATINALDGFSTTAYWSARFGGGSIDPATLTAANIKVIRLTLANDTKAPLLPPAAGGQLPRVLTFGTEYSASVAAEAGSNNATLVIRPLVPLDPSTGATNIGYLVVLTNGIHSTTGAAAGPDTQYQLVRDQAIAEINASAPACTPITNSTLNAICRLTWAHLKVAAGFAGVNPTTVAVTASFSTESTGDSLGAVAQIVAASPAGAIGVVSPPGTGPTGHLTTHDLVPTLPGIADVSVGTVTVPYYSSAPSATDPTAPVTKFWTAAGPPPTGLNPASRNLTRFNPVPRKTADLQIPLFVTVPNALSGRTKPAAGWPVAIFQHGLTRNRVDAVAIADAFASQGFVVVSIDLPLHGITPTNTLLAPLRQAGRELTFDLDVSNNATLAPGPDGVVDGSGQNFVNLSSLLTTRDNLRQGAVDLLALTRALPNLDVDGDTVADTNGGRIHFVGHSLGSIVGGVYARFGVNARTASLLMTGGGVAQTITDSPAFGPAIKAGLANQGLHEGTTLYNQFLRDAQTAADAGDPLNYFKALVAAKPVHVTQIVGDPTAMPPRPSDQVVPNSSTQRLLDAAGPTIHKVSTPGLNPVGPGNGGYVNFTFGSHGTIIDPTASLAATQEMQTQVVAFAAQDGAVIVISNPAVIQP